MRAESVSLVNYLHMCSRRGEQCLPTKRKSLILSYDNRLLVKPVKAAISCLPDAPYEFPYDGAKPMLRVTKTDDAALLQKLLRAMYDELPAPKSKKKKQ